MQKKIIYLFLSIFSGFHIINCDNVPGSRAECYKKEYCDTAVTDCITGSLLIGSLTNSCSSTTAANSSFLTRSFCDPATAALFCVGSDKACRIGCDKKHPL